MSTKVTQKESEWLTLTGIVNLTDNAGTSMVNRAVDFRGFNFYNGSTTQNAWIQIFNAKAADVTLGTTKPMLSFLIGIGADRTINCSDSPLGNFNNGMSYASTTTQAGATAITTGTTGRMFYGDSPLN